MIKEIEFTSLLRKVSARLLSVLLLMLVTVMLASPGFAFAAQETEQEEPIREVHSVGVGNELYCFFVTHNVVLTPAEVAEMTDEELTATILERAGLYMKKTNCRKESHKAITAQNWIKWKHGFLLNREDLEWIRTAEPLEGEPVKIYMDLLVTLEPPKEKDEEMPEGETEQAEDGDEEESEEEEEEPEVPVYSTYKRTGPRLIFAVVATEEDAKLGEEICKEDKKEEKKDDKKDDKKNKKKSKKPEKEEEEEEKDIGAPEGPGEEMLPEYRTIFMADRSGGPIDDTLTDGSAVYLEWREPQDIGKEEQTSFIDRIPGGIAGLIVAGSAAAAAAVAAVIAVRRKKANE